MGQAVAKCVAAVCASAGPDATAGNVTKLTKQLLERSSGGEQLLALLCQGELGHRADLSGKPADGLERVLLAAFDATGEELKSAASFAPGGVPAGH